MEAGQRRSHDEKNLCFAHRRDNCAWIACDRTRRQRAWAVLRLIWLLIWWPVIRLLRSPVVRWESHVCSGSTRAAEIQQSRPPRLPGRVTRLGLHFHGAGQLSLPSVFCCPLTRETKPAAEYHHAKLEERSGSCSNPRRNFDFTSVRPKCRLDPTVNPARLSARCGTPASGRDNGASAIKRPALGVQRGDLPPEGC